MVIYVFHVCYDEDMIFLWAVLQRHQAAPGNTLLPLSMKHALPFCTKHSHSQKNGHKCLKLYTEDNNEENKGTQTSFWSSLNWENRTSKNETCMLHYMQTHCLRPKGALQQQSHLRINNLFASQPNFLETFCTL